MILKLVERTDGDECPKVPEGATTELAETASVASDDLEAGAADFSGGGGIDFVRKAEGS